MAIFAAVLSTGPAILLTLSTTIVRDFCVPLCRRPLSDREQLICSKFAVVGVALLSTVLSMNMKSILGQLLASFQIRSIIGIVLVISLYSKRITSNIAFWSILSGGAIASLWHFCGSPFGIAPLWVACAVCALFSVFSALSKTER